MIFYFSATGNCRYVARRLAGATQDELLFIPDLLKEGRTSFSAGPGERVGLVVPTYFWGLPALVGSFMKKLTLTAPPDAYCYFVATCGVTPGSAGAFAQRLLRQKGFRFSALCSVRMPDTWTPIFDLSDPARVAARSASAEGEIDRAAALVQSREKGDFLRGKIPFPISLAFARPAYQLQRATWHFSVSDACVGCGLCEAQCPVGAIELRGGRPVWVKKRCEICLGCLHRCPRFAIAYGRNTAGHGQYQNPHP